MLTQPKISNITDLEKSLSLIENRLSHIAKICSHKHTCANCLMMNATAYFVSQLLSVISNVDLHFIKDKSINTEYKDNKNILLFV